MDQQKSASLKQEILNLDATRSVFNFTSYLWGKLRNGSGQSTSINTESLNTLQATLLCSNTKAAALLHFMNGMVRYKHSYTKGRNFH